MKVVIQRIRSCSMTADGAFHTSVGRGMLVLLGIASGDNAVMADALCEKIIKLRMFSDKNGKMNLSVCHMYDETESSENKAGDILVIPNFTLYGDCSKSRRPDFFGAERPEKARSLFEYFVSRLTEFASELSLKENGGIPRVASGVFGADMQIAMTADGPVTFVLEA